MKRILLFALFGALAPLVSADETVSLEEAQKAARTVTEAAGTLSDTPFTIEANVEKPHAVKGSGVGLMIVPDKKLTLQSISDAGETITPLAQLWSLKATVAADGKRLGADKLRVVTVSEKEKSREVQLYLLGVTKNKKGDLELVVYGKGEEPLLRAPIEKVPHTDHPLPIELSGEKTGDDSGTLTLNLFGEYEADISLMKAEE